eukprot:gene17070-biopygen2105
MGDTWESPLGRHGIAHWGPGGSKSVHRGGTARREADEYGTPYGDCPELRKSTRWPAGAREKTDTKHAISSWRFPGGQDPSRNAFMEVPWNKEAISTKRLGGTDDGNRATGGTARPIWRHGGTAAQLGGTAAPPGGKSARGGIARRQLCHCSVSGCQEISSVSVSQFSQLMPGSKPSGTAAQWRHSGGTDWPIGGTVAAPSGGPAAPLGGSKGKGGKRQAKAPPPLLSQPPPRPSPPLVHFESISTRALRSRE